MRKSGAKRLLVVAAFASSLLWGSAANALTVTIGLQQAGFDGGAGLGQIKTEAFGDGSAKFVGGYGSFAIDLVSGTGIPILNPSLTNFILNSSSINMASSTGGTISVYISEQGLTGNPGASYDFISGFTLVQALAGLGNTVSMQTWLGATDGLYQQSTELGTASPSGTGVSTQFDTGLAIAGAYSVTEIYTVTLTANKRANSTINLAVTCDPCSISNTTPLPAALPLLGSVLGGGLLFGKLRRRKTKA